MWPTLAVVCTCCHRICRVYFYEQGAVRFVGAYAKRLAAEHPALLLGCLRLVLKSIGTPGAAEHAATAFRTVSQHASTGKSHTSLAQVSHKSHTSLTPHFFSNLAPFFSHRCHTPHVSPRITAHMLFPFDD
jgi:hypothetical protein